MFLDSISIINYRNIESAELALSPNINCFLGDNGEGKTNFIDAVYYLSFCKSAFSHYDVQLLRHEQEFFMLEGMYHDDNGSEEKISFGMQRGRRKSFKRNGKSYHRLSEHIGLIPLILVSPSDTSVIEGLPEERRHLLDTVVAQYDKEYIDALTRYNDALQQRNHLLKSFDEGNSSPIDLEGLIEVYEEEMALRGELLFKKRTAFIDEITPFFSRLYSSISADKEQVDLKYVSHCQRGPLLEVIQRDRHKDIAVGYSLHGVHRDDLEMTLGGYPLKKEGSQGQNKTFVLALKLAQFEFLRNKLGKTPILLLDDIFDKLDAQRVEQIVKLVSSDEFGQIFITDTNRDHLDKILRHVRTKYHIFHVKQGNIVHVS